MNGNYKQVVTYIIIVKIIRNFVIFYVKMYFKALIKLFMLYVFNYEFKLKLKYFWNLLKLGDCREKTNLNKDSKYY